MIKDVKTGEILYPDPQEWIWIRRPHPPSDWESKDYAMAWMIQRRHLNSKDNIPCIHRVWKDRDEKNISEFVAPGCLDGCCECTEYEAYNYWKPKINYQIF